ncbi:MAG: VanZ family protein [Deltaproteobacteria bacterium]|nr:VanZ family protein [Deltaproteobacteria bacterium]
MARRLIHWLPALLYMGVIFILSSQSQLPVPYDFPESDKVLHLLLYSPLGFFIFIHQPFVPGRNASALDLMADGMGAVIGSSIFAWMRWVKRRKEQIARGKEPGARS